MSALHSSDAISGEQLLKLIWITSQAVESRRAPFSSLWRE